MVRADISISECDFHNVEVNTCRIPMAPLVRGEPWHIEMSGSLPLTYNLMTNPTKKRFRQIYAATYLIDMQRGRAVFQILPVV